MKNNWQTKKLGEISTISSGATPSRMKPDYYLGGTIPWVKSGELASGEVNQTEEFITHNAVDDARLKILPQGTPILAMYGATAGTAAILNIEGTTNQAVAAIQPDIDILDPKYTFYFLKFKKGEFLRKRLGGAQPNISQKTIRSMTIHVPPLSTQQQIVNNLDAIKKLQELNQKEIEKAEELFNSYLSKYSKISTGKQTKIIDELVEVVTKGTTPTTYGHSFTNKGTPFLRVENIMNDVVNPLDTTHYIDITTNKLLNRSRTKPKDILVTIAGTIGRIGYVPSNAPEMNMNQAVAVIRTKPELLNYLYLFYLLQTKELQSQMSCARVTGTITNISLTTIKNLKIFCPSVKEQIQVAEKLNDIMLYKKLLIKKDVETNKFFESALNKLMRPIKV